ncbi:MAG: preprotein translocase subunit SecY [Christensenellales bacterium]
MFKTIKNALKTPEVRKKLLYTLLLIVVFRFGCFVTVPGVDTFTLAEQMHSATNGVTGLIDTISGGAFSRLSIFAMSITPYITASIVIQLLSMVIPSLERLIKEGGEEGTIKVNKYTKILTILLALVEGLGIFLSYKSTGIFLDTSFLGGFITVLSLMTGTALLIWLGEQITNKGIGNGISMLIFVGIVSGLPSGVVTVWNLIFGTSSFSTVGLIEALGLILGIVLLIAAVVFIQLAERRIPVQYAKKVVGRKMVGAQNTHIPLKLAMAGVMPIIFASSFMTFPAMIIQIFVKDIATQTGFWAGVYKFSLATSSSSVGLGYTIANACVYLLLILGFTYFYTYAMFNPAEISGNIKRNGGFIPGIRAGKPTTDYLTSVISKLTLVGGFFLAAIAIIPMLARFTNLNIAFGGTSILILVGVALETVQQLESQLVTRHYKGFLE